MATKWKNFSRNKVTKAVLVLTSIISTTILGAYLFMFAINAMSASLFEILYEKNYINTSAFQIDIKDTIYSVLNQVRILDSDDNLPMNSEDEIPDKIYAVDINTLEDELQNLQNEGVYCSLKIPEHSRTYQTDHIPKEDSVYIYKFENNSVEASTGAPKLIYNSISSNTDVTVEIGFTQDFINSHQSEWANYAELINKYFLICIFLAVISVISFIWLLCVSGINVEGEKIKPKFLYNIFTEVQIAAVIFIFAMGFSLLDWFSYNIPRLMQNTDDVSIAELKFSIVSSVLAIGIIVTLFLYFLSSMAMKLRNNIFLKRSIIGSILLWIWHKIKGIINAIKTSIKTSLSNTAFASKIMSRRWLITICLLPANIFFFLVFLGSGIEEMAVIIFILTAIIIIGYAVTDWFIVKEVSKLETQIDNLYLGKFNEKSNIKLNSIFNKTSQKLAELGNTFNSNIEQRVKSERMKIDLVTNVSHDLKTPLTSIITYVDLLSKEELTPEARDYVAILMNKSDRLKNIVSDLFELAKTTSGEMHMDFEEIDLCKLTQQTLGDMEDKISSSDFIIKTSLPNKPIIINSDGKRLYRVMQNLIDNALKYSLNGTRIFINLNEANDYATISVTNTAGYEMTFTSDEILERFSRGDKSRSTEGSGLGLSIAQGFTVACGGQFETIIDGDQFKVIMKFKIADNIIQNSEILEENSSTESTD